MSDFSYYDEIDSQVLRQKLRDLPPFPISLLDGGASESESLCVDPSSTAFIDGSMVEALLRQSR